jgi:phosphotransferase system HPr-like phosphotransfer protein
MSDCKPVRAKPPRTLRASRGPTAARTAAGERLRSRASSAPFAYPRNTTSTESIAASIVGLMVLAADSGAPRKIDATDKHSSQVKAALTKLIAVRFDTDE